MKIGQKEEIINLVGQNNGKIIWSENMVNDIKFLWLINKNLFSFLNCNIFFFVKKISIFDDKKNEHFLNDNL